MNHRCILWACLAFLCALCACGGNSTVTPAPEQTITATGVFPALPTVRHASAASPTVILGSEFYEASYDSQVNGTALNISHQSHGPAPPYAIYEYALGDSPPARITVTAYQSGNETYVMLANFDRGYWEPAGQMNPDSLEFTVEREDWEPYYSAQRALYIAVVSGGVRATVLNVQVETSRDTAWDCLSTVEASEEYFRIFFFCGYATNDGLIQNATGGTPGFPPELELMITNTAHDTFSGVLVAGKNDYEFVAGYELFGNRRGLIHRGRDGQISESSTSDSPRLALCKEYALATWRAEQLYFKANAYYGSQAQLCSPAPPQGPYLDTRYATGYMGWHITVSVVGHSINGHELAFNTYADCPEGTYGIDEKGNLTFYKPGEYQH